MGSGETAAASLRLAGRPVSVRISRDSVARRDDGAPRPRRRARASPLHGVLLLGEKSRVAQVPGIADSRERLQTDVHRVVPENQRVESRKESHNKVHSYRRRAQSRSALPRRATGKFRAAVLLRWGGRRWIEIFSFALIALSGPPLEQLVCRLPRAPRPSARHGTHLERIPCET